MRNKFLKVFLLSSLSLVVSLTFASCGAPVEQKEQQGQHSDVVTDTDTYLLKNAVTDYKIVTPVDLSADITFAKDELKLFFKEATDINLPIIDDKDLSHNAENCYISLGDTNLYKTSGLNLDLSKLKRDGYYIRTKDKTIYIIGKTDIGALYGAYHFLSNEFNFETYTPNTHVIDKNVKNLKLKDYNVMENPDIDMRTRKGYFNPVDYSSTDNVMFAYRLRSLDKLDTYLLPIHEGDPYSSDHNEVHNSFYFLPKGKDTDPQSNINLHPKFYSASGQLCFTCQGDEDELNAMASQAGDHVIASLKKYKDNKDYSIVQFGIIDMTPMCSCEACTKCASEHNDSKAASIIIFLYKMGRYVTDWMNKPENAEYKRDLRYMFLAYADSLRPPFALNADGSVTIPTELKPYNDVTVMPYCCFDAFDESKAYNDDDNTAYRDYVNIWGSAYEGCFAWSYGTFFNDYFCFYDAYSFYADYYKALTKKGYSLVYEQLHSDQRGADTGFHQCIGYCMAKLSWNSNLDINVLIDNYFKAVYGPAYKTMKDIFNTLRVYFSSVIKGLVSNNGATVTSDKMIWNESQIGFVKQIMAKIDKAYQDISIYLNDEATYTRLKYNIDLEWLFPAKIILDCYKDSYNADEYNPILRKFKSLIETMQIKEHKEFTNISAYLATLSEK